MQSTDAPIDQFAQDRLGYAPFARTLATGILGRKDLSEGYVIGVEARWGMGKTSAVNLVLAAIEAAQENVDAQEKTVVVRISIWPTSGADVLARSYLQQLEAALKANFEVRTGTKYRRQIGKFAKKATSAIEAGSSGVAILTGAAAPAAGLIGKVTGALVGGFAGWLDPDSAEKVTNELRGELKKIKGQLLVIIDDLDRLHPDEMRQLLTLVKTFGDLPRVTHLLLYDRQIVDDALASAMKSHSQGPTYLEKIVQLSIALPVVPHWRLLDLLRSRLAIVSEKFDEGQLSEIWRNELHDLLGTPRDIIRLVNALSVAWPAISDHADLLDFICLESVRLAEQNVWKAIRDDRYELVGRPDRFRPGTKFSASSIVTQGREWRRASLLTMLGRLFPQSGPRVSGAYVNLGDLRRRRSVGSPEYVDVYFQLQPGNALGASEISEFLDKIDDEVELRAMLMALESDRNKLRSILNGLTDAVEALQLSPEMLLIVVLDIGDDLLNRAFPTPPIAYDQDILSDLDSLLWVLLKKIPLDRREEVLAGAVKRAKSITVPAILWQRIALRGGLLPDIRNSGGIELELPNSDSVKRVGAAIAQHLQAAYERHDNRLFEAPLLGWVVRIWAQTGEVSLAQQAARTFVDIDHSLVLIVDSEMGLSISSDGSFRSLREEPGVPGVAGKQLFERIRERLASPDFLREVFPQEQQAIYRLIAETFEKLAAEQVDKWQESPWSVGDAAS